MGAVDIGVGHDDDLVVAQLVGVEFLAADAGAQRRDQRARFRPTTASCRSAPARRSGSCRAAAAPPGWRGCAPCLALPPAESPSTMKISHFAGSRSWQSASLPGSEAPSSAPLRRVSSRALRAASRAAAASTTLPTTMLRFGRMFLEPAGPAARSRRLRRRAHFRGDQLVLGLRAEFRIGHLDRQHAGQALAAFVAGQRDLLLLRDAGILGIFRRPPASARRGSRPDGCRRRAAGCCW